MSPPWEEVPWLLRPYQDGEWLILMRQLAPVLARHYPRGGVWLGSRLDDVHAGRARATIAVAGTSHLGVVIETPKPEGQVKLSTVWVAPHARQQGIGRALLSGCVDRWLEAGIHRAWVTVCATAREPIGRLARPYGFRETTIARDRYGRGRHEWVLCWTPEDHAIAQERTVAGHPCRRAVVAREARPLLQINADGSIVAAKEWPARVRAST